jgi:hypothetical protein
MRLLTRLVLAGACAVTAWLLTGVVTVRAVDDPIRLGLLPGLRVPLVAFATFLALSGAVRRPDKAAGAVALACLASLPWWPMPLPTAALLLAGPLGWAWFLGCLACAIVLPTGQWWWWRARRVVSDAVRAPWLAAIVAGVLLTASAVHMAPRHPDGDEPDYLIIAQSLLYDGDLQIENNHARFDYEAYHDGVVPPSYLQRGRNGRIYPVHAAGLPLLLLPGFALAGYPGAVATVVLLCTCGVALLWRLAYLVTESAGAAWFGTAAAAGASAWFLHAFVVFPDAPASVLALVAVWAVLEPSRFRGWRMAVPALALAWLPWMHTRYVIVSVGLGLAVLAVAMRHRTRTRVLLAWLIGPAATGALLWFGFFWLVYGTPNPSAPYGAYTQTAWRQIPPGLLGLLVDQQFGVLATAPVLVLAMTALAGAVRRRSTDDEVQSRVVVLAWTWVATALAYLLLTASYRMWWGGLSAPARFVAPLVLPAGLFAALGWQRARSTASRQCAVVLLGVSLGLTAVMVLVDHGRLAYNERDGVARWAAWASPLVDLPGALPAAHRDAPAVVARDAGLWLVMLGGAWLALRHIERRTTVTAAMTVGAMGLAAASAATLVWTVRGQPALHPDRSQITWLRHDAAEPDARRLLLTAGPTERERGWFDLDLVSSGGRARDPFTALQVDDLPAGRYRLFAMGAAPGTRFGVAVGTGRATSFIAEATSASGRAVTEVVLPVDVDRLVVRSSEPVRGSQARVWLRPDDLHLPASGDTAGQATRADRHGAVRLFYPARGVHPEATGFWVAGDSETFVGLAAPPGARVVLRVRAGARTVVLRTQVGPRASESRLGPDEVTTVDVGRMPSRGGQVVRLAVEGGFRPALVTEGSDDARRLGVWVTVDQNLTTPLR